MHGAAGPMTAGRSGLSNSDVRPVLSFHIRLGRHAMPRDGTLMTGAAELVIAGLMSGLVIGLAALAVTLVFGIARFANAATGDTMTLGAYAALYAATVSGSLFFGGAVGIAVAAGAAVLAYLLVFRRLEGRSPVAASKSFSFRWSGPGACSISASSRMISKSRSWL
jgi:hypothetical protein